MIRLFYLIAFLTGIFIGLNFNINLFYPFLIFFFSLFTKQKKFILVCFLFSLSLFSSFSSRKNKTKVLPEISKFSNYCVVSVEKIAPFSSSFIINHKEEKFLLKITKHINLDKGEIINVLDGKIKSLPGKRNPWDFNSKSYYRKKGVFYSIEAKSIERKGYKNFFYRTVSSIRERVRNKIKRNLPFHPEERELIETIVIGKSNVPYFLKTLGIKSSSYHLLVISGIHLSFIFLFLRILFIPFARFNNSHPKIFPAFALASLWSYTILTGMRIPVVRATLMFTFFLLGEIFERDIEGPDSILIAAFILLTLNPLSLFSISFQLSFIITTVIIYTVRRFNHLKNPVLKFLIITAFAQISAIPIILYNFGQCYLTGFLSNIFLIPLSVALIISSLLSFLFPFLFHISGFIAGIFLKLMHIFSFMELKIEYPITFPLISGTYFFIAILLLKNKTKIRKLLIAFSFLSIFFFLVQVIKPDKNKAIYFFSYKKPCVLIKDGQKGTLFSPDDFKNRKYLHSLSFFIKKLKIKEINLIYTDDNFNHTGTLKEIKKYIRVKNVWSYREERDAFISKENGIKKTDKNYTIYRIIENKEKMFIGNFIDKKIDGKFFVFYINDYKKKKEITRWLKKINSVIIILQKRSKKFSTIGGNKLKFYLDDGCVIIREDRENLKIEQL